ncbi:Syntaxin-17 [Acropora cervicornis]|uniref:Syntaxin-17 n=1 Tax=Acropora cervicornis TaxID=6130 RepID=A0AAD9QFX4_ACRCE|nr:Syntaxin-17 [Acropora cervicornis]
MASFDSPELSSGSLANLPKHPLRRFHPALHKFQVALPADLQRLQLHKVNMEKYYQTESWFELNKEQINAARTVQQIKAHMKEIEATRNQIQHSDLPRFDSQIKPIQEEVIVGVNSFREVQQMYTQQKIDKEPKRMPFAKSRNYENMTDLDVTESTSSSQLQIQSQLLAEENAQVSWDSLNKGLVELNELIHDFSGLVQEQQETIDSIENNIGHAQVNIEEGTKHLATANKLKAVAYPIIGAAVGGLCGGPVGLAVGLKAGAAVAVGGGVLGFFGGKYVKKRHSDATDIQLENLSSRREMAKYD